MVFEFALITKEQGISLLIVIITVLIIRVGLGKLITRLERKDVILPSTADELRNVLNLFTTIILIMAAISILLVRVSQYIAYGVLILFAVALISIRDVIANYISYYVIVLSRVISTRDVVHLRDSDIRGRVTRITPMYTEIRTDEGHIVRIPNYNLLRTPIMIYRGLYRICIMLRIRGKGRVNVKEIEDRIRSFLERYGEIDKSKPPEIVLSDLSEEECYMRITVYVANPERVSRVAMDLVERLKRVLAPLEVTAHTA